MLLGLWKNIEELERYVSLKELELILKEARDKEHRHHRFLAAIQGIDLDAQSEQSSKDRFEAAQRRATATLQGKSSEEVELEEIEMDYEVEE